MMLAIIRPDSWELPLLVHVGGAMLLVAALVVVLALAAHGLRRGDDAAALARTNFRALLLGVLPAYVVMRVGAEWIASEEAVGDPTWIGIGYASSDGGLLLILVATGLAWRSARRGAGASRAVAVLSALLLVGYVVTVWAMTAKPAGRTPEASLRSSPGSCVPTAGGRDPARLRLDGCCPVRRRFRRYLGPMGTGRRR